LVDREVEHMSLHEIHLVLHTIVMAADEPYCPQLRQRSNENRLSDKKQRVVYVKRSFAIHSPTASSPENTTELLVEVEFSGCAVLRAGLFV
jgi:hypothetical protein